MNAGLHSDSTAGIVAFGGCGYVGRGFVREALARGVPVHVCDLTDENLPSGASFSKVDVRDAAAVSGQVQPGWDVVNFAGIADLNVAREQPLDVVLVNVIGNINILEACREAKVRKYGFASSAYVYSLHGSFYRISKRTCEEYIHEYSRRYGIPYVIFRYGSLYGGDSDASNGVHRMVTSALFDGVVRYRGGTSDSREYIHVKDASRISADLMLGDAVNQAFLLTGAERITIGQFFEMLSEILDKPLRFEGNNGASGDHYRMTQYNFAPIEAHKIHLLEHIDLGNGLLELIQRLYGNANKAGDAAPHVAPLETLV